MEIYFDGEISVPTYRPIRLEREPERLPKCVRDEIHERGMEELRRHQAIREHEIRNGITYSFDD